MPNLERKTIPALPTLKDAATGEISVEFATLNVRDHDGDITLPGAFGKQDVRIQPFGHDLASWSIGKGQTKESRDKAIFEGRLNLDSAEGREAYSSLKFDLENGAPLQEWSYTFQVEDSESGQEEGEAVRFLKKIKVFSVDPVFLGAGIGTRTLAIKEAKIAIPFADHGKAPESEDWERPALGDFTDESWESLSTAEKRRIAAHFVWSDSGTPPENFSDLGGGHHRPSKSGIGPAVWRGVSSGRMAQASWFPDSGVKRHLAGHYKQFDRMPPWEEEASLDSATFEIHVQRVPADALALLERARSLADLRAKEGRTFSAANLNRLSDAAHRLRQVADDIEELLKSAGPEKSRDLEGEITRFLSIEASLLFSNS